ncbi:hypothetical protein CONCODRAFT_87087 [Conidiobolus coronatus NRRL 28638]|uniref:RNI-like protein n=1 Tax=Conidiobolus coronatus (strain ATCC 28846 / CBS 209.66 / NRRL 28638) TaxID=796925 RepID=A0A137NX62_CONC2|nr:hypothetical protein CONCODRAFT_87087 [Conidiobolus coronatus NRRL 28638]|eukprot:KXN67229.1 hypothetical protein CONCODRAFT_87087 [Conidiobolus coronatus NRRL 28638]
MSERNWINVFLLREFTSYLNSDELINLSMSQRTIRLKLLAVAYSTFNFNSFIRGRSYKSYLMDKDYDNYDKWANELEDRKYEYMNEMSEYDYDDCGYDEDYYVNREQYCEHFFLINPYKDLSIRFDSSENAFKSDIKKFQGHPTKLKISNIKDYYYLLYKIPGIFGSITTLVVDSSRITYEVFEYLLNNLNGLQNLELTNSTLIIYNQNSNSYFINWPLSLKKLKFSDNEVDFVRDNESPLLLKPNTQLVLEGESLQISPKHLPNLVSLDYKRHFSADSSYSDDIDKIDDFQSFLQLNSHIKKLKMRFDHYSSALLKSIELFSNLEHLDISKASNTSVHKSELSNLPVLSNLKCLNLGLIEDPTVFKVIAQKFPNLARLIARFHFKKLRQLCYSVSELSNLKTLNLGLYKQFSNFIEFEFPALDNLESLEIGLGMYEEFENISWNARFCPKLRKVKFIRFYDHPLFEKPYLNSQLRNIWSLSYFPTKLTFYKIKK